MLIGVAGSTTIFSNMSTFKFTIEGNCGGTPSSIDCFSYDSRSLAHYDDYVIDLTGVSFIHPAGVVAMLCLTERLISHNKLIRVVMPSDGEVGNYLQQIHMIQALNSLKTHVAIPVTAQNVIPNLELILPVVSFYTEPEVEDIARRIETAMMDYGFGNILLPCYTVIAELAANVVHHSEGSRGWLLAQAYQYSSGRIIEIAVGDTGIGIRRSLRSNAKISAQVTNDKVALKMAVRGGVSRYQDSTRGNGLYQVCTDFGVPDRRLTLRSGSACLIAYDNGTNKVYGRLPVLGVLAEARIPC